MRLVLYQPDIAQNTGTILRLAACLDVAVDIVGPAGFDHSDRALRRAGMDYMERAMVTRHESWENYKVSRTAAAKQTRLVLLTTRAHKTYQEFRFDETDCILLGRESAGVPDFVHVQCDARVRVPMVAGMRSLNVAVAAAMVLGEALRQTDGFPAQTHL
ncbi:MAG: tRNA (cytidine(34)-2'-O)-methyltransferase [Hyphomicrobiaceae bacterium]